MKLTDGQPKIFGIGLHKTGTSTLGECGKILGYRCTSWEKDLLEDFVLRNDFTRIKQRVSHFDLFEDWPWPLMYKELDHMFPGSKFILTVRKFENVWLDSLKSHSMRTHPTRHCRNLIYGFNFPHKHDQQHLEFYRRHNVRAYFRNRGSDFIKVCWENGDSFEELCNFLKCDIPDIPMPHANKRTDNRVSKMRFLMNKLLSLFLRS